MTQITQSQLKELLSYDPETGVFFWLVGRKMAGKIAGCFNADGYLQIGVNGKIYLAHRLAWLFVNGAFPSALDHINGTKTDNRICNLRECTAAENQRNVGISKANTSGFKGVYWHKDKKKWYARIGVNSRLKNLGNFATPELASAAYQAKAREVHGEFYRAPEATSNTMGIL